MHRLIMGAPTKLQVDHVNRNTLDNRRENLRLCSASQNGYNRAKLGNCGTGYKGVCFTPRLNATNPFMAYINVQGKRVHLGYFRTCGEAAVQYNQAAKQFHGEFAVLNIL